jgi:hypothetical protein
VIAEQKPAISIVNERDFIDFSFENKNSQKGSQGGKNKQSIAEQENSATAAK